MVIASNIRLKGAVWNDTIAALDEFFTRPVYDTFMLALSIGIMYDKRIEKFDEDDIVKELPKTVLVSYGNVKLDLCFQTAILCTETEDLSEEERLKLAFSESKDLPEEWQDVKKISFLIEFANFGVTKLKEKLGINSVETMDNLKSFLVATASGRNIEINGIPDEMLFED